MLAGFDMGKENRAPKTTKRLSAPVMAPKRLGMNAKKPMSKPSSTSTSRRNNEEVFPLGEDDLKEF